MIFQDLRVLAIASVRKRGARGSIVAYQALPWYVHQNDSQDLRVLAGAIFEL